jgi:hypothetical protein
MGPFVRVRQWPLGTSISYVATRLDINDQDILLDFLMLSCLNVRCLTICHGDLSQGVGGLIVSGTLFFAGGDRSLLEVSRVIWPQCISHARPGP